MSMDTLGARHYNENIFVLEWIGKRTCAGVHANWVDSVVLGLEQLEIYGVGGGYRIV